MTPQRKKYFAQCSDKEKILRHRISGYLFEIQREKYLLNTEGGLVDMDRYKSKLRIKRYKYHLNAYRHELSRFKGMDKVVVPRELEIHLKIVEMGMVNVATGICKCGEKLESLGHVYCPVCGRRILWRRV